MNDKIQMQYYVKIITALNEIFNKDGENFIDVFEKEFSANDFFHVLATRVPQLVMAKLTSIEMDPLEFNHACNKLIMQDRIDNKKEYDKEQ
jgi:hypothetical protein